MSKFLIAYSKLLALKQNLPDQLDVEEYYVQQFHSALAGVADIIGKESVAEFQIEDSEIKPHMTRSNYLTGETRYSQERYCARSKLMSQIDAALNYLALQSPPEEKKKIMGFQPNNDN